MTPETRIDLRPASLWPGEMVFICDGPEGRTQIVVDGRNRVERFLVWLRKWGWR